MLARLRRNFEPLLEKIVAPLAALPAWVYTALGLVFAGLYLIPCMFANPLAAAALMLASGALDCIDGAVARVRGEASPRGAFVDSMSDRASDALYAMGFIMLGYPSLLVVLFLALSMMVSYARARYEAAARSSMEGVGLMERADRILAQAAVLVIDYFLGRQVAVLMYVAATAVTLVTLVERIVVAVKSLPARARA